MNENTVSKSEPLMISSDPGELDNTVEDATFTFEKSDLISKPMKAASKNKEYNLYSTYNSIEDAEKAIEDGILDSNWRVLRNTNSAKGMTRFYCCNMGSRKKGLCPENLKLIINVLTGLCTLMISSDEHVHSDEKKGNYTFI